MQAMSTKPQLKKRLSPRRRREIFWGYLFIAPTVIGLSVFLIGPIFYSFFMSLFKWDNLNPPTFIGLSNFTRLFSDPVILKELTSTLFFTFTTVPLTIIAALLVANALSKDMPGTGFFRSAFFTPYITLSVAAALVWQSMFNSKFGPINSILANFGIQGPQWLTDPSYVRIVIILMGIWSGFGYNSILLLSGIKNIPKSYFESAQIDGARPSQSFFRITIPLVTPQIFFVLCTGLIGGLRMFDAVYVFGRGGANVKESIRTMVYGIYERGFTYMEMGYASAEALLLFVLIMGVTIVQFALQKKWVTYDA